MGLILDTSVLINIERDDPYTIETLEQLVTTHGGPLAVTFANYTEFYYGALKKGEKAGAYAKNFLDNFIFLLARRPGAIHYVNIKRRLEKEGQLIPEFNILINAIVKANEMTLITFDKHFKNIKEIDAIILEPNTE